MPLFRTHDKTGNSSGIVLKNIIVTFTVVPALHKVVYLLWLSIFKVKVTRDSKNVCHGMYMGNSKSITAHLLFNSQVFVFRRYFMLLQWRRWPLNITGFDGYRRLVPLSLHAWKRYNFVFINSIDI